MVMVVDAMRIFHRIPHVVRKFDLPATAPVYAPHVVHPEF